MEGLFLSSAVCSSTAQTMERMIATVELVRKKYQFMGYVHLKLLPGCDAATVERAVQLADRVSINLEAPNPERLQRLSADKDFYKGLLQPLRLARGYIDAGMGARAGLTTQFVIGAAGESDEEILRTVAWLYDKTGLGRAYFSAFQPVPGTPLENRPATPLVREHRLYQSDFLLRQYGFSLADLAFGLEGNLHTEIDPKMAWAQRHPERFPIEVNLASREELLRIPGVGPGSATRIIQMRRQGSLRHLEELSAAGAVAARAGPFVLLNGRRPPQQLALFEYPSWQ